MFIVRAYLFQNMEENIPYDYEYEVHWEKDPSDLEYLREKTVHTRKLDGLPQRVQRSYIIYGWTNVTDSAPRRSGNHTVTKRMFYIKKRDVGGPDHEDEFSTGSPAEAVEIDSIEAGTESTEHEVSPDELEKWQDVIVSED